MRTLEIINPRRLLLTTAALAPVGLWALRSGYDNPHRFEVPISPDETVTSARFVVANEAHPLTRCWGLPVANGLRPQISADGAVLLVRWGRHEDLTPYQGQTLPFWIDYETSVGERFMLAEGEIEVESEVEG